MAKGVDQIVPDFKKLIKSFQSAPVMGDAAAEGARLIKLRTRTAGRGSNDALLRELEDSTIASKRKRKIKLPSKSRLTDSGDMLDNITSLGRFARGLVFFKDEEMAERAGFNEEKGRVFFDLSGKDRKKLTNFFRDIYRKILNKGV